jgi:diguanylate cyclase (GGDEF)-like protein
MSVLVNIGLFAAEAVLYFAVMAALFRARHRFGIGLFFCALGTMHFLETYLAAVLYVQFPGDILISPGSAVLFSGKLVMLLLVYIREDASTVRQPIYGLLIGNFLMVGLVLLMRHHVMAGAGLPQHQADFAFMDEMGWLMVWGTTLLFVDAILIVLLYERLGGWLGRHQTLRILASAATVLTFDQLGFFAALSFFAGAPPSVLWGGWLAKMAAALVFSGLAGIYLRRLEVSGIGRAGARTRLADVFDVLTYRERYEALLRETGHDPLTGLLDRGRFDREGDRAVHEAVARHRPVSLLLLDIDHFKRINDRHGHGAGDEALRLVARELGSAVREGDSVYRYGGEEFIVICEGLPHRAAVVAAERLRLGVSALSIPGIDMPITASVGVATSPEDGADLKSLFATADSRLYDAKFGGRDRVVGWRAPPPSSESVISFR